MSKQVNRRQRVARRSQIESLEDRLAMSADPLGGLLSHHGLMDRGVNEIQHHSFAETPPLSHHGALAEDPLSGSISHHVEERADFWLDPVADSVHASDGALGDVEQSLSSAHEQTGLNNVRANYGFRGGGQTVAVIDSGIAYDHYALGGGFGSNYRVVGGWDFTNENDADPYDDGPEGSHGTHVAGIIGSTHQTHTGVAPDVDLVGLRVFDDDGNGYFSWVERALQWVHNNRNAFENPITAVNLSLGTNWNSSSIPLWANLENEFAQLEADGIFISVSAGNSFSSYNEPGLSYPAASPYVVPVMSTDDSGSLSYFSQRLDRAIAAPGRFIYSTIPDYAGNNNGVTDDWANFSGTSMAAPYVAGASVIVREAMEFVGYTDITQDDIYDHMRDTADTVYDSATEQNYLRLNLGAAIDALMPTDDYGSDEASAYDLGTISGGVGTAAAGTMSGVISTLNDSDYFKFTAGSTGTVTFTASNTTHNMNSSWLGMGGEGWTNPGGLSYTMNVVAGGEYTVALSSSNGLGYYDLDVTAESTFSYTDWGSVTGQETRTGLTAGAAEWYRLEASQYGFLTVEALYDAGQVQIELYDAGLNLIDQGGGSRLDYLAQATEAVFLRVEGAAADVDFRLTNLVSVLGSTVTVGGTAGADAFVFTAGTQSHTVAVNGVEYAFAASTYDTFEFAGAAGTDAITMTGSTGNETATLRAGDATLTGSEFTASAQDIENVVVEGGGGVDAAHLYDTVGDDTFTSWWNRGVMYGNGYRNEASGFDNVNATASSGNDKAVLRDSAGDDTFTSWWNRGVMYGAGYRNDAYGFDNVFAFSSSGNDKAVLRDSAGDDTFDSWWNRGVMSGAGYRNDAFGFENVFAFSSSGNDTAVLRDSSGNDTFNSWWNRGVMSGEGYRNDAFGFGSVYAIASSGQDQAVLRDSTGDDTFTSWWNRGVMYGDSYRNEASGFDNVNAIASSGNDKAVLRDSAGDDTFTSWWNRGVMYGEGYRNDAYGFDNVFAFSSSGNDKAVLRDSAGDDTFDSWWNRGVMSGEGYRNDAFGFENVFAFSSSGNDTAVLRDSSGNDTFDSWWNRGVMSGEGYRNDAFGFGSVYAIASSGQDQAVLRDTTGDDTFTSWWNRGVMYGNGYRNEASGFDNVNAIASSGNDKAVLRDSAGDDTFESWWNRGVMSGVGYRNDAFGFDNVFAFSSSGNDTAVLRDSTGDDTFDSWWNRGVMSGAGYRNDAFGFDNVYAIASSGNDQAVLRDSTGDDSLVARAWGAYLSGENYYSEARDFEKITAQLIHGGTNTADIESTDYVFEMMGQWN